MMELKMEPMREEQTAAHSGLSMGPVCVIQSNQVMISIRYKY